MTQTTIRFCEFTGDEHHEWDEVGFKSRCEHLGFKYCTLHNKPLNNSDEHWRKCCSECTTPIQIKEIK